MRSSLILLLVGVAAPALAFDDGTQFFNQKRPHAAMYGASGEGVYFTGAPRFTGLTCSTCHTDGPGVVQLKLGADPPDLFTVGYRPGMTYLLEVDMRGETKGLDKASISCTEPPGPDDTYTYQPCNNNSFGLEVDLSDGTPLAGMGVYCSQSPMAGVCPMPNPNLDEVVISPDGDAVFGNRQHDPNNPQTVPRNDPTSWHVWWTAPPAGSGPLTVYVSAVDGNGGDGTATNDQDPYNDDTIAAAFPLQEAGMPAPPGATAGCSVGGRAPVGGAGFVLLLFALAVWRRRVSSPQN